MTDKIKGRQSVHKFALIMGEGSAFKYLKLSFEDIMFEIS